LLTSPTMSFFSSWCPRESTLAGRPTRGHLRVGIRRMRISSGWLSPSLVLAVPCRLYPQPAALSQVGHQGTAQPVALLVRRASASLAHTLAGPPNGVCGIPPASSVRQRFKIRNQCRILSYRPACVRPPDANPMGFLRQFPQTPPDGCSAPCRFAIANKRQATITRGKKRLRAATRRRPRSSINGRYRRKPLPDGSKRSLPTTYGMKDSCKTHILSLKVDSIIPDRPLVLTTASVIREFLAVWRSARCNKGISSISPPPPPPPGGSWRERDEASAAWWLFEFGCGRSGRIVWRLWVGNPG